MGDHDAPTRWLDRWREQEPLRLYLWSIACAVIVLSGVAGWLTAELAVAITGVADAVLMLGGTAAARREAYAPLTVQQLLARQHADSYEKGARAGVEWAQEHAEEYLPAMAEMKARPPEEPPEAVALQPATEEMEAQPEPRTALLQAQGRCPFVDTMAGGRGLRCTLPVHPDRVPHRLEGVRAEE